MTPIPFHPITKSRKPLAHFIYVRDALLTIVLWWVYLFFMKDFFLFMADVANWGWHGFANTQSYKSFEILPTFLSYIEVIGGLVVVYIGWARYNQLRFRGKNRRRAAVPVSPQDLANFYVLGAQEIEKWQQAKTLTIYHDRQGNIIKVE